MKFNLPRRARDFWMMLVGFVAAAPVLIGHRHRHRVHPVPAFAPATPGRMASAVSGLIFIGTALPEEILFRALIQNFILQRWGETTAEPGYRQRDFRFVPSQ